MLLGEHCSRKDCHQRDFLPVRCDRCHRHFCKLHFSYDEHDCPLRNDSVECPLCARKLPITLEAANEGAGNDPQWIDRIVDEHIRSNCHALHGEGHASGGAAAAVSKSKNAAAAARKCGEGRCEANAIVRCKRCGGVYCLQHRIEGDHKCTESTATARSSSASIVSAAGGAINKLVASVTNGASATSAAESKSGPRGFTSAEQLKAKYGKNSGRLGARRGNDYRSVNSRLGDLHKQRSLARASKGNVAPPAKSSTSSPSGISGNRDQPVKPTSVKQPSPSPALLRQKMRILESKFSNTKHNAVGQSSIEHEDRFFLDVFFPLKSRVPPVHMFFSRNWKVGKVLDRIASQGKIVNSNATESDPSKRLNLFHIQTHERIPTDRKLVDPSVQLKQHDKVILEYGEELSDEVKDAIERVFEHPESSSDSSCTIS